MNMKHKGFTLIEFIIYISLTSFLVIASLNFIWTIVGDKVKQEQLSGVNDSGAFVLKKIFYSIQRADGLNGQSVFNIHPGKLVLNTTSGQTVFDTYQKNVSLGSTTIAITKLRMTEGISPATDLTSDEIDVRSFVINNFSNSGATTIRVNLTLGSVNPAGTKIYEAQNSWTTSATIRKK